jgi:putative spermidine/putrescine transport system permease protein
VLEAANTIDRSKRLQDASFQWFVGAVLVLTSVAFLLPMLVVVALSFDARSYLGPLPPTHFSWHWYERFFSNDLYVSALGTSLQICVISVLISTSAGVSAALAIHRGRFFGRDALLSLFMAPLIVPAVVVGFSLVLFLGSIGVSGGLYRLVAGHVLITMPYCIRTTLASLQGIPPSLHEAALVLGAREWPAFWTVIFPLARRGIAAGAIFAFAMSLDDVSVSLFLVEPPHYTLPVALLTQMRANFDLTIAAVGTMLMVFTIVLIAVLDHLFGLDQLFGRGVRRA